MNKRLQDTIKALEDADIDHELIELGGPAVRSRDVLDEKDLAPEDVVKTLMFKKKSDGSVFCAAVRSNDRVSYKKLRKEMGGVSMLHPDQMRELGWEPGECCPLNVPGPLLVDPTVTEKEWVHTGSGDLEYGLEYPAAAIQELRSDVETLDVRE